MVIGLLARKGRVRMTAAFMSSELRMSCSASALLRGQFAQLDMIRVLFVESGTAQVDVKMWALYDIIKPARLASQVEESAEARLKFETRLERLEQSEERIIALAA